MGMGAAHQGVCTHVHDWRMVVLVCLALWYSCVCVFFAVLRECDLYALVVAYIHVLSLYQFASQLASVQATDLQSAEELEPPSRMKCSPCPSLACLQWYQLPAERLYASYFEGDAKQVRRAKCSK